MQITLTGKDFDKAMENYVKSLGLDTSKYTICTRTVVGRGDTPSTTVTLILEEICDTPFSSDDARVEEDVVTSSIVSSIRKFGQGHADE